MLAGMTSGSDLSRYSKGTKEYIIGTTGSLWMLGTLVSFMGLATMSAAQNIYGKIYWNCEYLVKNTPALDLEEPSPLSIITKVIIIPCTWI